MLTFFCRGHDGSNEANPLITGSISRPVIADLSRDPTHHTHCLHEPTHVSRTAAALRAHQGWRNGCGSLVSYRVMIDQLAAMKDDSIWRSWQ